VHNKTVRRRRALLALLVALSLILLTAYFGEANSGPLHSVQRGFLTVVAPIQDGANKALKPVRDLFGWFSETAHAKAQNAELRKQVDKLRREIVADQIDTHAYHELLALYHLDGHLTVANYRPVTATVIGKTPNLWYTTVKIGAGTDAGVQLEDPVINGEGLVGKITLAASDGAQVSLITDSSMGVSARLGTNGATGIVQPKVGEPNDLLLQYLPADTPVHPGEYVFTSGTVASPDDSLYPPGIPIGTVTSIDEESAYTAVNVHPLANLRNLDTVQVLTAAQGSLPARLASLLSSVPPGQSAGGETGQLASTGVGG
jgi:rod shape-determining protein MreC